MQHNKFIFKGVVLLITYLIFELVLGSVIYNIDYKTHFMYFNWVSWFYNEKGKNYFQIYMLFMATTTIFFSLYFFFLKKIPSEVIIPPRVDQSALRMQKIVIWLTGIFIIFQTSIFIHSIISDYYLANEYKYIEEKTKMQNGSFIANDTLAKRNTLSEEEEEYSQSANHLEAGVYQPLDRYYIHENSFILCPINEIRLNRPLKEVFSQYGYLNIELTSKLMDIMGGFSIQNYEKIQKFYYLIYFLTFSFVVLLLFRDHVLRFISILLFGYGIAKLGFYAYNYAPGIVPVRHIIDLPIMILLIYYEKSQKKMYLITASVASIFAIWMSKDFGQFIFISMLAVLMSKLLLGYLKNENKTESLKPIVAITSLLLVAGGFSLIKYPLMDNPSVKYFLDGFYAFSNISNIIFIGFMIALQWIFLVTQYQKLKSFKLLYIYIFLLFYTQLLYSYPAWGGEGHFYSLIYIFALPMLIILYVNRFEKKIPVLALIAVYLTVKVIDQEKHFIKDYKEYNNIFQTHQVYKWEMPRGGIYSTIDPDVFNDSVALIHKYSEGKKIYMISKYDNILSIFSEKYSGFPFFELRSSIVTQSEYDLILQAVRNDANILFVDNDIDRNFYDDIAGEDATLEDIKQRVPKLQTLKRIYNTVKNNYILVEKGKLISVYKKR